LGCYSDGEVVRHPVADTISGLVCANEEPSSSDATKHYGPHAFGLPIPRSSPAPAPLGTIVGLSSSATINLCVSSSEDDNASLFDIQMYDKLFFIWEEKKWGLQKILYSKENNRYFVSGGVLWHSFFSFFYSEVRRDV